MELAFLFFYKIEIKMATIAKGSITLVNVNDAYSVLFTPDSCAIKADFDGTNPDLTNAYTDITVVRGEEKHTFKLTLASFSNTAITYQQIAIDAYTKRIRLTSIPSDVLSGALTFTITTDDEFVADVTFTYSVIRETSMLDWILDWENNKTVIGDSYLISPKIFVGKKVENAEGLKTLTGVYIGPDDTNTAGIYGYKEGKDVFHINAKGAMLGGWNVLSDCITTSNENGTISLGADGNLFYRTNKNELVWSLFQDGSATFAKGNVMLNSDGSAVFTGSIKASSGNVGGWTIDENVLYNTNIALNSAKHVIGVGGSNTFNVNNIKGSVQQHGGVYMFYDNANSYGLQGYLPSKNVGDNIYMIQSSFSLGSINQIASWNFDADSLYMGAKVNMQKKYTASSGDITIGSQGMRGNSWYIDTDGSVSFLKGEVQFAESSGSMVGWNLNAKRLSNPNVAIVSDTANAGIFMSVADGTDFNSLASSSLTDYIDVHGGIYMKIKTDGVSFAAYDKDGYKIFKLRSNGVSSIASWNIENDALFVGSKKVDAGSFTDAAGSMTFSSTGIRGNKWRLEADGSGSLAGDMISWNAAGEVDFKAKVSADNITAGTISACTIQSSEQNPAWQLNANGTGFFAKGNIFWNEKGEATFTGGVNAKSGKIGDIEIYGDHIGVTAKASDSGSGSWANLSIYKNFFKVGGNKGYAMFGNDVIPSSCGGAFTAVGRIVNQAANTYGYYGFDQANYGLFIDVSGGTKNYGISSNAALLAPAFVNTRAKILTFDPNASTYSIDFSQSNVILMYYYKSKTSGLEVELPSESSVAYKFGLSKLPDDFATIVIFRVREGSLPITLKGIYDHNEGLTNYKMAQGDSVQVLISKVDGFRYQILNHSY